MEADCNLTFTNIDSASLAEGEFGDVPGHFPYVHYPPHSAAYLRDFLAQLASVSGRDPASLLSSLTEPSLYTLAAALGLGIRADGLDPDDSLRDTLISELRWRNCKSMGAEPMGPARRGRLVQLAATCTVLRRAGASPLQRHNLAGVCPFCGDPGFRVFLPTVSWQCFACQRHGALLQFAEHLLTAGTTPAD